eukprot:6476649-Prymnesium_polylepis.2
MVSVPPQSALPPCAAATTRQSSTTPQPPSRGCWLCPGQPYAPARSPPRPARLREACGPPPSSASARHASGAPPPAQRDVVVCVAHHQCDLLEVGAPVERVEHLVDVSMSSVERRDEQVRQRLLRLEQRRERALPLLALVFSGELREAVP